MAGGRTNHNITTPKDLVHSNDHIRLYRSKEEGGGSTPLPVYFILHYFTTIARVSYILSVTPEKVVTFKMHAISLAALL